MKTTIVMLSGRNNATETDGSDALWIRDLAQIETLYGRLVYLAALRNPDNGRYEHFGSSPGTSSSLVASRNLKRIHEAVFRDWIGLPLERKKADIELYMASVDQGERCLLVDAWLRLTPYKNLVPASVQGPERQRHISDFEAILGLFKNVYGVASPDQDA
jgi:hypothetical protein